MENLSLWKLQDVLLEAEEGLSDETVNLDEVIGDIRNKVDNIKQIIDMMYDEAARFKRYELEMKKKGTTATRAAERLEGYVLNSLEAHNTTFELGNVWTAKIREGKYVNTTRDPEPLDLMLFPNLVKTSYSWDKRAIKDTLVEKPLDFAEMAKSRSLTFTARKPTHD
jgi:hypothetical protein